MFFIAINNESEFETGEDPQLFGPFNSKDSAEKFLDGESSGIFNTIEDSGGEDSLADYLLMMGTDIYISIVEVSPTENLSGELNKLLKYCEY